MVSSSQASTSQPNIPDDIAQELSAFNSLTTDDKLGLLWVLYENMGESVTPAAPGSANTQFTERLYEDVKAMSESDQLAFMRDLVEKKQTEQTKTYGTFVENNKLAFWYQLSEGMAAGDIIPVPDDYELPSSASKVFTDITALDFERQITLLRHAVLEMGA
ncbi:orange carotenoid protein N-terminal domain-containing protein [Leptolyngbya sp. BC1307]|uniref:orange carotenoid protein N-terminal domain-containing protein n=1 Tax=Leptolyngbya sp. BC1307 TaxID=2029589 RepID=UPI000EFA5F4E|nr:orange carotenoid protein N-terminal domain-containing protein [Leptolyngbya sp. BC1307]